MNDNLPIAVVGAGLGGLAAACTLAARGYRVLLFDKNKWGGGKAAVLEKDGFRFDMGPTILTLPRVLRRIFSEAGLKLEDHLEMTRLDPQWRSFFSDGSVLDLHQDTTQMSSELDRFSAAGTGHSYQELMALSERLHKISDRYYFWKSIGGLRDMFDAKNLARGGTLKDVLSMRMGSTVGGTFRRYIKDRRVSQMLDHFTQYVGSSPDASPAVLCGIAHMQTSEGVWYPKGGTRGVAVALEKLAHDLGVHTMYGTQVNVIETNRAGVKSVLTSTNTRHEVSAVVSNADSVRTHRELLDDARYAAMFDRRRSYEPACSGVVLYLGLKQRYEHLLHHNFVFSRDPHEEFDHIYRRGEPAPDPTCYLCAPSVTDPTVAPRGGEALYVLVHTPYLRPNQDWSSILPAYRKIILEKLKSTAGLTDIEDRIVFESHLTPQDIHDRYRVLNGAIYGLASHGRFFGAFKPGNRAKLPGLYLCGGAAHPGPGMPMVMMSGWIAADALDQDFSRSGKIRSRANDRVHS
ncbi:MAG: phytoene desaturase family protein [Verrucomicrobiota bacterium]